MNDYKSKSMTDLILYDGRPEELVKGMVMRLSECAVGIFWYVKSGSQEKWVKKEKKEMKETSECRMIARRGRRSPLGK